MNDFQKWLAKLDKYLDLNNSLKITKNGKCLLMFDDLFIVEISMENITNSFKFKTNFGTNEYLKQDKFLEKLMEANFCWEGTNGAVFTLSKIDDKIILVYSEFIENCNYNLFKKLLETFVNTSEYWKNNIKKLIYLYRHA